MLGGVCVRTSCPRRRSASRRGSSRGTSPSGPLLSAIASPSAINDHRGNSALETSDPTSASSRHALSHLIRSGTGNAVHRMTSAGCSAPAGTRKSAVTTRRRHGQRNVFRSRCGEFPHTPARNSRNTHPSTISMGKTRSTTTTAATGSTCPHLLSRRVLIVTASCPERSQGICRGGEPRIHALGVVKRTGGGEFVPACRIAASQAKPSFSRPGVRSAGPTRRTARRPGRGSPRHPATRRPGRCP